MVGHASNSSGGVHDEPRMDAERIDQYKHLRLLQRILSEVSLASARFTKVSLAKALRRYKKQAALSVDVATAWGVVLKFAEYMRKLPSEDRASSYALVCKMDYNAV